MKILLVNDDGIAAKGIRTLAARLKADHDIIIAAPDRQQSGVGHAITFMNPLRVVRVNAEGLENVPCYAVSGTPVDCVKFGTGNLMPDCELVISGINHGGNLGSDVYCSGTVSAAVSAALDGIPALAVSLKHLEPEHFDTAARVAENAISLMKDFMLVSVNVPDLPYGELKGTRVCPLGYVDYTKGYIERSDPHGYRYYWLPAGFSEPCRTEDTDTRWLSEGYVTVTPLSADMTDRAGIATMIQKYPKGVI